MAFLPQLFLRKPLFTNTKITFILIPFITRRSYTTSLRRDIKHFNNVASDDDTFFTTLPPQLKAAVYWDVPNLISDVRPESSTHSAGAGYLGSNKAYTAEYNAHSLRMISTASANNPEEDDLKKEAVRDGVQFSRPMNMSTIDIRIAEGRLVARLNDKLYAVMFDKIPLSAVIERGSRVFLDISDPSGDRRSEGEGEIGASAEISNNSTSVKGNGQQLSFMDLAKTTGTAADSSNGIRGGSSASCKVLVTSESFAPPPPSSFPFYLQTGVVVGVNSNGSYRILCDTDILLPSVSRSRIILSEGRSRYINNEEFTHVLSWVKNAGVDRRSDEECIAIILYHRGWRVPQLYLLEQEDVQCLSFINKSAQLCLLEKAEYERDYVRQRREWFRERLKEKEWAYVITKYSSVVSACFAALGVFFVFTWNYLNYVKQGRQYQLKLATDTLKRATRRRIETANRVSRVKEERNVRKMLRSLDLSHPRVVVITGRMGCGKSNILKSAAAKEHIAAIFVEIRNSAEDPMGAVIKTLGVQNIEACGDLIEFVAEACHSARASNNGKVPVIIFKLRDQKVGISNIYNDAIRMACDKCFCHVIMEIDSQALPISDTALPRLDFLTIPDFSPEEVTERAGHLIDPFELSDYIELCGTNSSELDELISAVRQKNVTASTFMQSKIMKAMRQCRAVWKDDVRVRKLLTLIALASYDTGLVDETKEVANMYAAILADYEHGSDSKKTTPVLASYDNVGDRGVKTAETQEREDLSHSRFAKKRQNDSNDYHFFRNFYSIDEDIDCILLAQDDDHITTGIILDDDNDVFLPNGGTSLGYFHSHNKTDKNKIKKTHKYEASTIRHGATTVTQSSLAFEIPESSLTQYGVRFGLRHLIYYNPITDSWHFSSKSHYTAASWFMDPKPAPIPIPPIYYIVRKREKLEVEEETAVVAAALSAVEKQDRAHQLSITKMNGAKQHEDAAAMATNVRAIGLETDQKKSSMDIFSFFRKLKTPQVNDISPDSSDDAELDKENTISSLTTSTAEKRSPKALANDILTQYLSEAFTPKDIRRMTAMSLFEIQEYCRMSRVSTFTTLIMSQVTPFFSFLRQHKKQERESGLEEGGYLAYRNFDFTIDYRNDVLLRTYLLLRKEAASAEVASGSNKRGGFDTRIWSINYAGGTTNLPQSRGNNKESEGGLDDNGGGCLILEERQILQSVYTEGLGQELIRRLPHKKFPDSGFDLALRHRREAADSTLDEQLVLMGTRFLNRIPLLVKASSTFSAGKAAEHEEGDSTLKSAFSLPFVPPTLDSETGMQMYVASYDDAEQGGQKSNNNNTITEVKNASSLKGEEEEMAEDSTKSDEQKNTPFFSAMVSSSNDPPLNDEDACLCADAFDPTIGYHSYNLFDPLFAKNDDLSTELSSVGMFSSIPGEGGSSEEKLERFIGNYSDDDGRVGRISDVQAQLELEEMQRRGKQDVRAAFLGMLKMRYLFGDEQEIGDKREQKGDKKEETKLEKEKDKRDMGGGGS